MLVLKGEKLNLMIYKVTFILIIFSRHIFEVLKSKSFVCFSSQSEQIKTNETIQHNKYSFEKYEKWKIFHY